ncbi:YpmS family protein [Loigolactobacillus bifermentans]|nr:YpmS family protein [Loigolactobacillus bifermentans]QGG59375.1 DUF2140 family protein [Loigolactobacillus bifermentans]
MTTKQQRQRKPVNVWKWLFIGLVVILLAIGVYYVPKLTTTAEPQNAPQEKLIKRDPTFGISLKKQQVNAIVGYYLEHYLKNSKVKYQFSLGNQAVLKGKFKLLGYPVPFSLYLAPYVRSNGDVALKARRLAIGTLKVPIKVVMNYIGHTYKFPKWISLNSKDQTILVKLNQFKMKNGMQIKAKRIDLPHNDIDLNVYIPQVNQAN